MEQRTDPTAQPSGRRNPAIPLVLIAAGAVIAGFGGAKSLTAVILVGVAVLVAGVASLFTGTGAGGPRTLTVSGPVFRAGTKMIRLGSGETLDDKIGELEKKIEQDVTETLGPNAKIERTVVEFIERDASGHERPKLMVGGKEIDAARVLAQGTAAQARVRQVFDAGLELSGNALLTADLQVQVGTESPYDLSSHPLIVPGGKKELVRAGGTLPVKVDRSDPNSVVVDWSAT